jgi:hypothetical protein
MRILLLTLLLALATPAVAQRAKADLDCTPAKGLMTYDCTIRLTRDGKPLDGIDITVGADMPSMPMAHNVKPVKATRGDKPGEYRARIELEMAGEWVVKLRLSGAVRDQIIVKRNFE